MKSVVDNSMTKKKTTKNKKSEGFDSEQIIKNQKEAAKYANCDERTIRRWVAGGMHVTKEGYYIKALLDHYRKTGGKDYDEEQHRHKKAEADVKELKAKLLDFELKVKKKELIPRREVDEGRIKRILAVKRLLQATPRKMSSRLEGKKARVIQEILREEVEYIIRTFAGDAEELTENMD